jgi:cell division control protein 24
MLTRYRSDSQVRAEDHQKQLLLSMETLLKNNEALAQMFLGSGVAHASSTWSQRTSIQHFAPDQGPSEMPGRNRRSFFDLPFEKDLSASRVYRRIKRDTMDFSMRSSVARSNGWSIFSGMSLSDISEISVLALPIIPSDVTNPQHYFEGPKSRRACELSLLPASVSGSSIFHECVELEAQLVQLTQCLFKQILERERSSDILATLVSVFRRGAPLLQLYNQLDDSYQDKWKLLLSQAPSPSSAKLAVVEFIEACVMRQAIKTYDCFTVTDLMDDDIINHVKVCASY